MSDIVTVETVGEERRLLMSCYVAITEKMTKDEFIRQLVDDKIQLLNTINEILQREDREKQRAMAAIERSGLDVSKCRECGETMVCLPDGLSNICDGCLPNVAKVAD